jgi:hypothetical protein
MRIKRRFIGAATIGDHRIERTAIPMLFAALAAPALALLVLAAHFYRAGWWPLALLSLALIALLAVPRAWAARGVQVALLAGALEWVRTLAALAAMRLALEQPYLRLVAILLAVAVLTALSAAVFRLPRVRARFGLAAARMRVGAPP